ncbi:MAG: response regulator transcription factor [Deltaproteobacteria bacterium]|jgi:DNA-binding response OmpR family regulator|nr:response regulator transcription factor [Deltaproteobacteria bacterium]
MVQRVLIVEDEDVIRMSLSENLALEGYKVTSVEDGEKAITAFKDNGADLVVLDLMLPKLDGLEVLKQIKALDMTVPVIILTARSDEVDKVVGLEIGADDYLTKPFGMRELFARVKALLRRTQTLIEVGQTANPNAANNDVVAVLEQIQLGDVRVDFKTYRAFKSDKELEMSVKEFELLRYLVNRPDIPVARNDLLDEVWGYNSYPTTRTVDNFIARLRQKIEDTPDKPRYIITVHGIGYKFVP